MELSLLPFQEEGVEFLCSRKRAALLDDRGLGKSVQACVALRRLGCKKILFIVPADIIPNWEREWSRWGTPGVTPFFVSYNLIQYREKVAKLLMEVGHSLDAVVCDEAQAFSSWSSNQTRNFVQMICPKAGRIYFLTADPSSRSAGDLHPMLSVLEPGRWGKFGDFKDKYCYVKETGYGRYKREIHYGWKNTKKLTEAIERVALLRLKENVLKELPPKEFLEVEVKLDSPEDYQMQVEFPDHEDEDYMPESVAPLVRKLGVEKASEMARYLRYSVDSEPCVVWAWHKEVLGYLSDEVFRAYKRGVISGAQTKKSKEKAKEDFQAGKLDVLICQPKAAGVGNTFHRACRAIFVELPWSAVVYAQAVDRIHRIGQRRRCTIVNLFAPNTIDQRILERIRYNARGMKKVLGL